MEQTLPWKNTVIGLTGFSTDVKNYIEKDEATQIFLNNNKYRFRGFELTGETMPVRSAPACGRPTPTSIQKTLRPARKSRSFSTGRATSMHLRQFIILRSASLPMLAVSHTEKEYFYSKKSPFIKRRLNDYSLLSLRVAQKLLKDKVTLYCGVDNLLDENYEQSYGLPQAGRYIYGGLELRF